MELGDKTELPAHATQGVDISVLYLLQLCRHMTIQSLLLWHPWPNAPLWVCQNVHLILWLSQNNDYGRPSHKWGVTKPMHTCKCWSQLHFARYMYTRMQYCWEFINNCTREGKWNKERLPLGQLANLFWWTNKVITVHIALLLTSWWPQCTQGWGQYWHTALHYHCQMIVSRIPMRCPWYTTE